MPWWWNNTYVDQKEFQTYAKEQQTIIRGLEKRIEVLEAYHAEPEPQFIKYGFGKNATGGEGGQVIKVTNLNDSGTGSLRQALQYTSGPRIIEFDGLDGTINMNNPLSVTNGNVTVDGSTGNITLRGNMTIIEDSNVIIRNMRFRPGSAPSNQADGLSVTAWGSKTVEDVLIDHCSISNATDENFDIRVASNGIVRNVTLQNSIVSNSGYGCLASKRTHNVSIYNCFFANNKDRNITSNYPYGNELDFEMINNIVFGFEWATSPSLGSKFTVVNNIYKKGLRAVKGACVDGSTAGAGTYSNTYAYIEGNQTTANMLEWSALLNPYIRNSAYNESGLPIKNTEDVEDILDHVGCSLTGRDNQDEQLINEYLSY
ncbi:MAG: hypothetical protein HRU26_05710 [Psychroserpens sp.]|nr:hypothetical protein [Psychroserpens sp.]